jgi:glycogen debranching enzyme
VAKLTEQTGRGRVGTARNGPVAVGDAGGCQPREGSEPMSAAMAPTILDEPLVRFGREVCDDLTAALRREWLVTNGLGGYASGTLAGIATRRYHGLLVAALAPPAGRTVLVGGAVEWAVYGGRRYPLSACQYADGTVDPHGYRHIQSFALEGMLPVWTFALGDALLERRLWMAPGANTTYVSYALLRGTHTLELEITPLVTYRDFHALASGQGWQPGVEPAPGGAVVHAFDGAVPFRLLATAGRFEPQGVWYWGFRYAEETARGLDDRGDLYAPGTFTATLYPTVAWTLALTAEAHGEIDVASARAAVEGRQLRLLQQAGAERAEAAVQQLTLAADQFVVERRVAAPAPPVAGGALDLTAPDAMPAPLTWGEPGAADAGARRTVASRTVIAGYHWFNDWGRDTMIALPGLTLATGRPEEAAAILRAFGRFVRDGLLPNNFPDDGGADPGYNTADAALWYLWAVHAYAEATGDAALVDDLLPALRQIVDAYAAGTRYGIGVDPADGLLRAGEPGVQLTWMDAKVGDWVVTPRVGKAVELNALWYNALRTLAGFLAVRDAPAAAAYAAQAERARAGFLGRFRQPGRAALADVIDGPAGDDWSVRPNQIFAVSLPFPLLEGADAEPVVEAVGQALLTSYGLRSLSPDDPAYQGHYGGGPRERDGAYHQGTVWAWLLGAYAEAHYRVYGDRAAALALLRPVADHLHDAGLGTISEIFEGDAPHLPRGCIAQAWSVAEALRVWRLLAQE